MLLSVLREIIENLWEERETLTSETVGEKKAAIDQVLTLLDEGECQIAVYDKKTEEWQTQQWLKKAVLLSFLVYPTVISADKKAFDKIPLKFVGWQEEDFKKAGFRVVSGAIVRKSAFIDKNVVLMPCFVNVGARIGSGTMIDTWATVGSCAQVGTNCHISGGVGLGGVLEPLQARPVIIEDNCFIGARSEIAEGVVVGHGSVISMGVFIGASTPIIDRSTGKIFRGKVPANSVVVPGTLPGKLLPDKTPGPNLACAVIVKRTDDQTRLKTSPNDLLRNII